MSHNNQNPFVLIKFSHQEMVYTYIALRHEVNSNIYHYTNNQQGVDIITIDRQPPTNDDDTFVVVHDNDHPPPPPPGAGANNIRIRIIPLYIEDMNNYNHDIRLRENDHNNSPSLIQDNGRLLSTDDAAVKSMKKLLETPEPKGLPHEEYYKFYKLFRDEVQKKSKGGRIRSSARCSSAKKRASRRKPRSAKKRATRRYRRRT